MAVKPKKTVMSKTPVRYRGAARQVIAGTATIADRALERRVSQQQSSEINVDDPKSLLNAANAASGPARNAWLAFLGLLAYLLITLAGVTHEDLLLNNPIVLPVANVKIPLFSFFLTAPFLFVMVHLGLLVQHAMLAHKYQQAFSPVAGNEIKRETDYPDRRLVHNYVYSQLLVGPKPPIPLSILMRAMIFATFSVLPVLVLLLFQVKFLPYHDVASTHAHRIAILLDIALLCVIRPFATMPYLRPYGRKLSFGDQSWRWEVSYISVSVAGFLYLVTTAFSLLVATVPQACAWPFGDQKHDCFSLDKMMADLWPVSVTSGNEERIVFVPTKWLFEGELDEYQAVSESLFSRNLVLIGKDLVAKRDFEEGETSLQLQGRDLRFAALYGSNLRGAFLGGSDLRGIAANGTRFDNAVFSGAQLQGALLTFAHLQDADLQSAQLQGADLDSARMRGANLSEAQFEGAVLRDADMERAILYAAHLNGVNLYDANMQGASLWKTNMRGANLEGANLQGASLTFTQLQGAYLFRANLQGAVLDDTRLQGANLTFARLQGTDLRTAHLDGADLRRASMWQSTYPSVRGLEAVLISDQSVAPLLKPLEQKAMTKLSELIVGTKDDNLQRTLKKRLGPLLNYGLSRAWEASEDYLDWKTFIENEEFDLEKYIDVISNLACNDNTGGYVIRRLASGDEFMPNDFRQFVAPKIVNKCTCPAAKHLNQETIAKLTELASKVDD